MSQLPLARLDITSKKHNIGTEKRKNWSISQVSRSKACKSGKQDYLLSLPLQAQTGAIKVPPVSELSRVFSSIGMRHRAKLVDYVKPLVYIA